MNLSRFFKTIFLLEFVSGLYIAIKELFENQRQLIILLKKDQLVKE